VLVWVVLCGGCGCGGLFLMLECYFLRLVVAAFLALVVAAVLLFLKEPTRRRATVASFSPLIPVFVSLLLLEVLLHYFSGALCFRLVFWLGLFCGVCVEVVVVVGGKFLC
jgi:hypothetical protein